MTDLPAEFTFRPVEPSTWPDFECLFASRGAPHYCWCLPYRATREEARPARPRNAEGQHGPAHTTKVNRWACWPSMATPPSGGAPSHRDRRFHGSIPPVSRGAADANDASVWSLTCFFVPRRFRGRGLATRLLNAAIDRARTQDARAVEAYPADPDSPSYPIRRTSTHVQAPPAFATFGRLGKRRHVMRLDLLVAEASRLAARHDAYRRRGVYKNTVPICWYPTIGYNSAPRMAGSQHGQLASQSDRSSRSIRHISARPILRRRNLRFTYRSRTPGRPGGDNDAAHPAHRITVDQSGVQPHTGHPPSRCSGSICRWRAALFTRFASSPSITRTVSVGGAQVEVFAAGDAP